MTEKKNMPIRAGARGSLRSTTPDKQLPAPVPVADPFDVVELELREAGNHSPLRRLVIAGLTAILLGIGGFLGWAFASEISSAAVANGSVIVDSKRKTVSHFEGGILSRLLIQEGDKVEEGQPLIKLDDTRALSDVLSLQSRRIGLIAKLARLKAEQAEASEITFPEGFGGNDDPAVEDAIKAEQAFFQKRKESQEGKIKVQQKTIEEHSEAAKWLAIQIEATDRQISLMEEQREAIASLVDKGFAQRSKLIEIDTRLSELASMRGELSGDLAGSEKAKAGAEVALVGLESQFQSEVAGEITTARVELADVEEQIVKAKDILRRLEIRSPQTGIVTEIRKRTPGSAITPGEPLLDIVPENELMVVEMKVSPRDIDSVRVGQKAQIRITSYSHRTQAPLDGKVVYLAADQTLDEQNNLAYFVARAEVDPESLAKNPDVQLYPGMPAEVLIVHKPRTAMSYLISPISESLYKAFREE